MYYLLFLLFYFLAPLVATGTITMSTIRCHAWYSDIFFRKATSEQSYLFYWLTCWCHCVVWLLYLSGSLPLPSQSQQVCRGRRSGGCPGSSRCLDHTVRWHSGMETHSDPDCQTDTHLEPTQKQGMNIQGSVLRPIVCTNNARPKWVKQSVEK